MKILLGMSGGIDSSFAAIRLMEEGHTVEGAVILMHEYTDVSAARESADQLSIPLHVIDARERFESTVIPNFIEEYKCARTPNPCIICNSDVKFRVLCDFARENGFDKVSTGHYANIIKVETEEGERSVIARAADTRKDQTYMLWRLGRDIIEMLYFPLHDVKKDDIRRKISENELAFADRIDSQEICFIPSGDYAEFIESRVGKSHPGDFVDENGRVLGTHNGIIHYTVGQRKGLGIALGARAFITEIDVETNRITLSTDYKISREFLLVDSVITGIDRPENGETVTLAVKVRYEAQPVLCRAEFLENDEILVTTDEPVRSVTEGQSAVLYLKDILVGGGFIRLKR